MWALLLVIAVVACGVIGFASSASNSAATNTQPAATTQSNNNQATQPASTTAPTQAPTTTTKWTTTHTYKGTGSKKTGSISVPDDWKIVWSCDHTSFDNIDYNVIIIVYNTDGSIADTGVNSMCTKKNTHDETEIHTSGNVYLDITSEGAWNIQIQELK